MLVCAPTSSGKTNVALLAILKEISYYIPENSFLKENLDLSARFFKIIYVAPLKALASEIVDKFDSKLSYLGIRVKELTGDMQLTRAEILQTHIIVTTPEKLDVVTRKTDNIMSQVLTLNINTLG
jgi:replicative superfamily II helicase